MLFFLEIVCYNDTGSCGVTRRSARIVDKATDTELIIKNISERKMMMKKLSLRILASLMALLLIMGLAACGGSGDPESSVAPSESSDPVSDSSDISAPDSSDPVDDPSESSNSTPGASTTAGKVGKVTSTTAKTTRGGAGINKKAATWAEIKKQIPASAKGVELRVYDWNATSETPGLDQVLKNFTKETNIKVDYKIVNYNDYHTKIASEVASKNAPDAVRLQGVSRKDMQNLQPMQNLGFDFTDAAWDANVLDAYTFNGNLYGVNMIGSPFYCPVMVYYNTNLIDTYDLEDPYQLWKKGKWTWDKVWELCEEFLDEANSEEFIGLSTMAYLEYQIAYNKPIITYDKTAKTFSHNMNDKDFIKSWQTFVTYYQDGYISEMLTNNDAFDQGKLLFNFSNGIASRKGSAYFKDLRAKGTVGCVPLPALKSGAKDYQMLAEPQAFGIPKTAKNAKLVPYFLRYYFDGDNYDMKNFYNVDHAAEVIQYIQTKNPSINYAGCVISTSTTGWGLNVLIAELKGQGPDRVIPLLEERVTQVEPAMAEAQSFYASL